MPDEVEDDAEPEKTAPPMPPPMARKKRRKYGPHVTAGDLADALALRNAKNDDTDEDEE